MSKKTVRGIFIAILIFLPLQYIMVGIVGYYWEEPWPAFVFPGFKNVYETNGQYEIKEIRFELCNEQNEKVASVYPHRFFPLIPRSQISGLLRSRFHNSETIQNFSPEAQDFLLQASQKVTNENITSLNVVQRTEYLRTGNNGIEVDSVDQQLKGKIHFSN